MSDDDVLTVLKERRAELETLRVVSTALLGPAAKEEEEPEGRVNILIELKSGATYFDLFHVEEFLRSVIGSPVQVMTRGEIRPLVRKRVLQEAVDAWT